MMLLAAAVTAALTAQQLKVQQQYEKHDAARLVPMLSEVIRFPTVENDLDARAAQQAWLMNVAKELGFTARNAGKIVEIELPGAMDAPVLGLIVHGDVQPVDADAWSFPPFEAKVANGYIQGRGSADDKGPLVQALLAMHALKESRVKRSHTIRLLVGSTEESDPGEIAEYLKDHRAPDYTLVLDSNFPVVVGEKAWNALKVTAPLAARGAATKPYEVVELTAGLAASIVPDRAEVKLRWVDGTPDWSALERELNAATRAEGTRLVVAADGDALRVVVYGKSAHAGVNLEGGRNALVALARLVEGKLPAGGADDLLTFARLAGQDLYGTGLGITDRDPIWGRYAVNVATIKMTENEPSKRTLTINLRRIPPRTGPQLEADLRTFVDAFNQRTGAALAFDGYWADEPLGFDPKSKLVKRLLADYAKATGEKNPKPAISGGGTYAKRLPNSIAFGMWFPDKPYPGHDVDEKNPIADLQRGTRVLIATLVDIATGPKIEKPFEP